MAYYSAAEMEKLLDNYPKFREKLYCKGFLLTDKRVDNLADYPFYNNWKENIIVSGGISYYMYINKEAYFYTYQADNGSILFLVGHAYNPFTMQYEESEILKDLSLALESGEDAFWDKEGELTGVFCLGYFKDGDIVYTTDCAGMQLVYDGVIEGNLYVTSHSKIVADFYDLKQPEYIKRLISNKFWHYWGNWLPGDLSPYNELKRLQANCKAVFSKDLRTVKVTRYYPTKKIEETTTEEEYRKTIEKLGDIMSKNMTLIAKKWPDKKISISVTGGRDSMTTLACTNGNYDKYSYFSYISNNEESYDAYAAKDILKALGLKHELYTIPDEWEGYKDIDAFKKVMECNAGCIGPNNPNDLKKRLYFCTNPPCDIEVKSWVNEIGRGRYFSRFNKKSFPKRPTAKYWRTLHKAYIYDFKLMRQTTKVFQDYLDNYYGEDVFDKISWVELYYWEFSWGGGEGVFMTSEHRIPYDITVPFNNRKYVELMLTVPLEKRKQDAIPKDLTAYMNKKISDTNILVKDVAHTDFRAFVERVHLAIYSKI